MGKFIHIRSSKFPILPGEKEELVNEGMYGKALAEYLQAKLRDRGYNAPFVCREDWGCWVELRIAPFAFGVCIYSGPEDRPVEFVCTDGATGSRQWSWKRFRFVDTLPWVNQLREGASLWWCVLLGWPESRASFMAKGAPDSTLLAFVASNGVLFIGTAVAAACGFWRRRPWAWAMLCVHAVRQGLAFRSGSKKARSRSRVRS
jgi:hypothetical protein